MGSDDIFKRRKAQTAATFERQKKSRSKGPRFLIVCEGAKTEPYYFEEFCQLHQLRTPRVRIAPNNCGSSPDRVVRHAEQLFDEDAQMGADPYDKVFCVFDRDNHSTFKAALDRIKKLQHDGKPLIAITSHPCFEYWLLLHFTYTRMPFHARGRQSIADNVIKELRKQPGMRSYNKADKNIYGLLRLKTAAAIRHAKQAAREAEQTGEKNPSTQVHLLVDDLTELAKSHGRVPAS